MKLCVISLVLVCLTSPCIFAKPQSPKPVTLQLKKWWEPEGLKVFKKAYPNVKFISSFNEEKNDWEIHIFPDKNDQKKETVLFWCEGKFLPEEELENKNDFRSILYKYEFEIPDPKKFTEEQIERIKEYTSRENRQNSAIEPPYFYNAIYQCDDRISTEARIKKIDFLGKSVNVHENIADAVSRVSKKVMALPKDAEMQKFFSTLTRTDGYAWRSVRDTKSRSFHSLGIAIDILPKGYYQKIIYWSWQKQLSPDNWFMTPISKRWTPPQSVINIFREEGFIWGGTWIVWDNMHFEYHPELIIYAQDVHE